MQDLARTMLRTAVSSSLVVARWPFDLVVRAIPDGEDGSRAMATSFVDRADGTLRGALGGLLHDSTLEADGRRRLIAAGERARARQLRREAVATRAEADDLAAQRVEAAEARRQDVLDGVEEQQDDAATLREERLAAQRRAAAVRKAEVARDREAAKAAVDKEAKRDKLRALDDQAAALDSRAAALVAADEAERLATATATAKSARKERRGPAERKPS